MSQKPSNSQGALLLDPQGYFHELVQKGLEDRKIKTYPVVHTYLTNLLQHFLDARNLFASQQTLAEMYMEAQNAEAPKKFEMLRQLADRTLYISGFFGDSLQRKIVDVDYYASIGGSAYASLAHCTREDTLAKVYTTFSHRFVDFVDVLSYISQSSLIRSDESILRLYERYMRTGSELAREKLVEMGVLTLPQDQAKLGRQS